jgi:putative transcriptional regulator
MTNTLHHPSAELLLDYSAGTASPSHALCVATHLEFCQACRKAHQRNNAIGGKLIDELGSHSNIDVNASIKTKVLDLLDKRPAPEALSESSVSVSTDSDTSSAIPRALRRLVPKGFKALNWQLVSATARSCQLFKDDNGTVISLLKIKPGGRIAKHRHLGNEYTVVLTGAFSDEDGVYRAGDFLLKDGNDSHSPVATRDAECICLTLQEAPLQFTGWLFKLLNPWIRNQFQTS